jgi:UDP-N-acetylglucosamine--N-acetylmuramyl-(pentapeptide) pyrophosphoryl-undecaprenol N-acetylglucosamine transferase
VTVAIAAAGTGGHVFPALAVARALVAGGLDPDRVVFLGGDRLEARAVPAAGFPFERFHLAALRRSLSPRNLGLPWIVRRTARAMAAALEARGTRVVLGMGGYVSVPAVLAARRLGLPFFVQEQNAIPGLAVRLAARRARAAFVGLPGPAQRLPRAILTGNPLREELARVDRTALAAQARRRYDLPDGSTVLGVLGGSLGARVLNQAVPTIVAAWRSGPLAVVHLAGIEVGTVAPRAAASSLPWRCLRFEDEMQYFYAAADLVLCRAGAMTISELAATGTPAVLVPLERVGQQHNAAALVAAGGARLVAQAEVATLPEVVGGLLGDASSRAAMAAAARTAAFPDAAAVIAGRLREATHG